MIGRVLHPRVDADGKLLVGDKVPPPPGHVQNFSSLQGDCIGSGSAEALECNGPVSVQVDKVEPAVSAALLVGDPGGEQQVLLVRGKEQPGLGAVQLGHKVVSVTVLGLR